MLSLSKRLARVFEDIWPKLPALKDTAGISDIVLDAGLGAVHGQFSPDAGLITINPTLIRGDLPQMLARIDIAGNDPPQVEPCVARIYHTLTHELFHALLYSHGLDDHPQWLALSGWQKASDDPPGTGRYVERRPGWVQGPSEWRYRQGSYFVRPYASRSPYEDAADLCTHCLLGWDSQITDANGRAKRQWLKRMVWGDIGTRQVQASRDRWRHHIASVVEASMGRQGRGVPI